MIKTSKNHIKHTIKTEEIHINHTIRYAKIPIPLPMIAIGRGMGIFRSLLYVCIGAYRGRKGGSYRRLGTGEDKGGVGGEGQFAAGGGAE